MVHTGHCIMGYRLVYWRFDRICNSRNFLWPLSTTSSRRALGEALAAARRDDYLDDDSSRQLHGTLKLAN
jgi:hypothetical protein